MRGMVYLTPNYLCFYAPLSKTDDVRSGPGRPADTRAAC